MKKYLEFLNEFKISYSKELCPKFWEGKKLIPRIEDKLLRIAHDFFNDLEFDTEIIDIQLTGSLANYNYTKYSDLDVHILIDFSDVNEDIELVRKAADGDRFAWNMRHDIIIKEHDVEIYVQDINDPAVASGLYSLMNHKWIKEPVYNPPTVDTASVDKKFDAIVYEILELEKLSNSDLDPTEAEKYYKKAKDLKKKISNARKEGLAENGEFSIENLVFKRLRNEEKYGILIDTVVRFYDKIYSQ